MSLKLNSSGGGSVTLQEPVTASDLTVNLPATLGNTGGSMLVTSDASGNVGLGVTPSAWQSGRVAFQIQRASSGGGICLHTAAGTQAALGANYYFDGTNARYLVSAAATSFDQLNGGFSWNTAPSGTAGNAISFTQAMTLDASGNLLLGTTGNILSARLNVAKNNSSTLAFFSQDYSAGNADNVAFVNGFATGGNAAVQCRFYNNALSSVGTITSSGSATAYNTSSDYRLKENVQPMTGALAKVQTLKPCTYNWKADGSAGEGFIAHELAEILPQAVAGEKDAVDADGKPVYQGIDTSFLVATVVAALQELKAELDTVKAELAVLKGTA